jgi:hypothetical protein
VCSEPLAADNTARLCSRCVRERRDQFQDPPAYSPDDEFWTTDELRSAFESQHIGRVLKAYRHHPRFLRIFGKALNQEVVGRWLTLTQAQVSRLENGKPELNLQNLHTYANTLHLPQKLLWFDLPGQTRLSVRDDWAELPSATPLVTINAPSSHLFDPLALETFGTDPGAQIRRLTAARSHFEQMYRNSGGLATGHRIELFLSRHTLSIAATINDNAGDVDDVGRKSRRAIGGLIALAGVCAYDAEDWNAANSHFRSALAIADASRDHGFRAYVIALMVNQALALEDFKAAETLASIGLHSSVSASATSLTVDLKVMRAKALASMGDNSSALSAIRELEAAVDRTPLTSEGLIEASYIQEGQLQAQLAEALTNLGDLNAAHRYAERSISGESHARGRVNRLASMATLEIARGDIERASFLACEMLDAAHGMESRRLGSRFARIRAALASRPADASREAIDRLDVALLLMP